MTNLTRVAINARKAIRYGVFSIIIIMVGKFLLDSGIAVYRKFFPSPPPPPTVTFGKLTKIPFPEKNISSKFSFVLETPEGSLPKDLPTQAKVFFMPKVSANLLSLDVAKQKAKSLEFTEEPIQESDTVYKFGNPKFPSVFQINIITGVFSISYDLISDRTPLNNRPPVAEIAASDFRSILSAANVLPDDLDGPVTHDFYKLSDGKLAGAISLSESDVIKVNLFRKSYEDLPSMTANPNEANVWAILSGSTNKNQKIIAAEYHYFPVDETQSSTYPIKTPEEAFTELQNGSAYIASMGQYKDGDAIKIRRMYLAYFDPESPTDFYQPIYVFDSSDNNPNNSFVAYLPAVNADYYGQ